MKPAVVQRIRPFPPPVSPLLDMLLRIRDENTAGAAIFALGSFREKKMEEWLRPGLYREDAAASPDRVPQAVPALLEDMLRGQTAVRVFCII